MSSHFQEILWGEWNTWNSICGSSWQNCRETKLTQVSNHTGIAEEGTYPPWHCLGPAHCWLRNYKVSFPPTQESLRKTQDRSQDLSLLFPRTKRARAIQSHLQWEFCWCCRTIFQLPAAEWNGDLPLNLGFPLEGPDEHKGKHTSNVLPC